MSGTALLSNGVRLHYYEAGEGDDVIVLLHGWPQTGWQWRHVLPLLSEQMGRELADDVAVAQVARTGHWLAEQNAHEIARLLLDFVAKIPADTHG